MSRLRDINSVPWERLEVTKENYLVVIYGEVYDWFGPYKNYRRLEKDIKFLIRQAKEKMR